MRNICSHSDIHTSVICIHGFIMCCYVGVCFRENQFKAISILTICRPTHHSAQLDVGTSTHIFVHCCLSLTQCASQRCASMRNGFFIMRWSNSIIRFPYKACTMICACVHYIRITIVARPRPMNTIPNFEDG